jgi:protocatechuate 3,4-dioxygenase beta subunit
MSGDVIMTATKKTAKKVIRTTAPVEEGPYYKTGSPERNNIVEPGTPGSKLVVEGRVLDTSGRPLARAWLDFWHADGHGRYDNEGYNLRGHQYADSRGRYHLETVRPLQYLSRAPHIHAKVRADEGSPILTTQLFFPGEKHNETDSLFESLTVMDVTDIPGGQKAAFDFVVETV